MLGDLDESALQALYDLDEQLESEKNEDESSISFSEYLGDQGVQLNKLRIPTEVRRDNPAMAAICLAGAHIASERSGKNNTHPSVAFSFDVLSAAMVDSDLSHDCAVNIATALSLVPGYNDQHDIHEQSNEFHQAYDHAATMALHWFMDRKD